MRLSKNFMLAEFEKSQTAIRLGYNNEVPSQHLSNVRALVNNVLQPVRDQFGPVTITSGYRSKFLNQAIGGSTRSQHCSGMAADFEVPGLSNYDLAVWIRDNLEFDQLILEGHRRHVIGSGWVHCSYTEYTQNRKETLTAEFVNGRARYSKGLIE